MRVLGTIGDIMCTYQAEKTTQDGRKYWSERYQIALEFNEDTFLVDTFMNCSEKGEGMESLSRRGIEVGAKGVMVIRFGFRDWNGKRYSTAEMLEFTQWEAKTKLYDAAANDEAKGEYAAKEAAIAAEAKAAEQKAIKAGESTDMPF